MFEANTHRSPVTTALVSRVSSLTDEQLVDESRRIAALLTTARAELGVVLAEVEARALHEQFDCGSVERFAGWHCQLSPANARATTVLGRAVHALPALGDAVIEGRLAADKAVMIARVAGADSEAALVELSHHTSMGQLQKVCSSWRAVASRSGEPYAVDPATTSASADGLGRVLVLHDESGVELRATFDHVHGALVLTALDAITATVRSERADAARPDGHVPCPGAAADADEVPAERLTRDQWRAEGMLRMCELAQATVRGELQTSGFATQVVVHVPIETLMPPTQLAGIDDAPADVLEPAGIVLRRDAARWLACDAGLLTVLEDSNGDPLHLGRRSQTITPHLRRAVHARYRTCTWPGCVSTVVQLHHRHHRSVGGHDDVENLVPFCRFHHQVVHRRGITVARTPNGEVQLWRPDGSRVEVGYLPRPDGEPPGAPAGEASHVLECQHRALGIDLSDRRRHPQWQNDPFNLNDIIEALEARRDAARRRTHPTGSVRHGAVIITDGRSTSS